MELSNVIYDACASGEDLLRDSDNIIQAKIYCAKSEIYCRYLQNNLEEADLLYSQFREQNDLIFKTACSILDIAIDKADAELAGAALKMVNTMKSAYPDFYRAYYTRLWG